MTEHACSLLAFKLDSVALPGDVRCTKDKNKMVFRFWDRWSKSKAFSADELAILRLLLPPGTDFADRLYEQATDAPWVERTLVGSSGYEAKIPYVLDSATLIDCDEELHSPSISVATNTDTRLNFCTTIFRGGFLLGLRGQTSTDEPWQK